MGVVLHHVSIEIATAEAEDAVAFWRLLGFEVVEPPEALSERAIWVERAGTQIHLVYVDQPTVPVLGHPAVVVEDFDATLSALERAGHQVSEGRRHWGAARALAIAPGGHRVELMASPPPSR